MPPSALDFGECYLDRRDFEQAKAGVGRKQDLIEQLLSDLEAPTATPGPIDIDRYSADRVATVDHRVSQIRREIKTRAGLKERFLDELDSQIAYAQQSLERFAGWGVGYNTGVDVKRNHLERQLHQLRTERRRTELQVWDDLVRLRKELRDALADYRSVQRLAAGLQG